MSWCGHGTNHNSILTGGNKPSESAVLQVYESNLTGLKARGDPIIMRYTESQTREAAVQQLSNKCQHGIQWATKAPSEPQFSHIPPGDLEIMKKECMAALQWLEGKNAAQAALAKYDDPAVLTSELIQRKQTLENVIVPIMTKPVPPPPKPAPEPEKKVDADKEQAPMEEDTPAPAGQPAADASTPAADAAPMDEP
jgi:hypothetical protein